jgi:hypothetical protein
VTSARCFENSTRRRFTTSHRRCRCESGSARARHLAGGFMELGPGRVERLAFCSRRWSSSVSVTPRTMTQEQRQAELFLELMNVTAERRLGDMETFRGLGNAQGVSHGDEGLMCRMSMAPGFYTRSVCPAAERCIGQVPRCRASVSAVRVTDCGHKEGFACVV